MDSTCSSNNVDPSVSSPQVTWKIVKRRKNRLPFGYLGVLQREVAERKLKTLQFAVYHQLPPSPLLANMKTETNLACVFRSSRGIFTHFPICEYVNHDSLVEYYVDTGTSTPLKKFKTINDLILYYCRPIN